MTNAPTNQLAAATTAPRQPKGREADKNHQSSRYETRSNVRFFFLVVSHSMPEDFSRRQS
jgi:hypothetical protein